MKLTNELTVRVEEIFRTITNYLIEHHCTVTCMESCTSGLLASLLTDTEGASAIFPGSFVAYSNPAKIRFLVPAEVIDTYGVYSGETASAMAHAARDAMHTDYAFGITGTFGNVDPANADSVPGVIWFSVLLKDEEIVNNIVLPIGLSRRHYKYLAAEAVGRAFLESDEIGGKR